MKEELFELRAKMVDLFREVRGTEEAEEIMININELSAAIEKLNEEDLNNNIDKLNKLNIETNIAMKNIEETLSEVRKSKKKYEITNTALVTIRDAVTALIAII